MELCMYTTLVSYWCRVPIDYTEVCTLYIYYIGVKWRPLSAIVEFLCKILVINVKPVVFLATSATQVFCFGYYFFFIIFIFMQIKSSLALFFKLIYFPTPRFYFVIFPILCYLVWYLATTAHQWIFFMFQVRTKFKVKVLWNLQNVSSRHLRKIKKIGSQNFVEKGSCVDSFWL